MSLIQTPDAGGDTVIAIDVGGFNHPNFLKPPEVTKRIWENVPGFRFRKDDLMLCSFPKAGSNWLLEMITMVLNRSAERVKATRTDTMLEISAEEEINQVTSPRVITSHYPPRYLPLKGLREKQIKTILLLRNPKDTAVSYYNHMLGIKAYSYSGQWKNWLPTFLEGQFEYGKYSDYLLEWELLMEQGAGFPLYVIYYEDLKMCCRKEIDRLLDFLDFKLDDDLIKNIIDNCTFEKMAKEKKLLSEEMTDLFIKKGFKFFRKGVVGDWKNWFTVSQNEHFETIWQNEMKSSTLFKFTYSDQ